MGSHPSVELYFPQDSASEAAQSLRCLISHLPLFRADESLPLFRTETLGLFILWD